MFPKQMTIFQLKDQINFDGLALALPDFQIKEVGTQEEFSFGSSPLVRGSDVFSIISNECMLIRFSKEEKVLPSSVVREAVDRKVGEIELLEGRKVGRKEKSDIKDELIFSMRPKAFSKRSDVWMHIDSKVGVVAMYTTAASMIELASKQLQVILGSFPMVPVQTQCSPIKMMTYWLNKNLLPVLLETGDECEVKDNSEDNAKAKFKNLEPLSYDVTRHLEQGMVVSSLGLRWAENLNFVLHDDLTIRKIKFDDALKEAAFNDSEGGGKSDLDASFAISSLTIRNLLIEMAVWFVIDDFEVFEND